MCLFTTEARNKRYVPTIKNQGIPPLIPGLIKVKNGIQTIVADSRIAKVPIPCGKCIECRKKNKRNWQVRVAEELKHNNLRSVFVTFTFNTPELSKLHKEVKEENPQLEGYDIDNKIAKLAVKRFLQRWKKHNKNKSVKHWFITELGHGQWKHLHLHGLLWTNENENFIQERWIYGNIWTSINGKDINGHKGYVNEKTINYIVKYVNKIDPTHKHYNQIVLCSPGIGKGYLTSDKLKYHEYKGEKTIENYRLPNGRKIPLPTYYKRKIWTDEERTELWRDKLDKQKEYICGEEIDVSTVKGIEDWFNIRNHYRTINYQLGGGDNKPNVYKRKLEQQRRNKIYFERCIIRRKNKGLSTYEHEAKLDKLIESVSYFHGKCGKLLPKYQMDLKDDIEILNLYRKIPRENKDPITPEVKKELINNFPDAYHIWGPIKEEYDVDRDWTEYLLFQ